MKVRPFASLGILDLTQRAFIADFMSDIGLSLLGDDER
jgi:hypothetical protein